MIVQTHPILRALEKLPFEFHLTGSRSLGTHTEASDYDFFVAFEDLTKKVQLQTALKEIGFDYSPISGYSDDDGLEHVFRWIGKESSERVPVDVMVGTRLEITKRLRVFEALKARRLHDLAKALKGNGKAWRDLFVLVGLP